MVTSEKARRSIEQAQLASGLSRRGFLRAAMAGSGLVAGSAVLGACGSDVALLGGGKTTVQLWHLFTGGDGGVFVEMMDLVREQNPEVAIDPVVLTWGAPYYTKLAMASVGGRAPDLAVMHLTRVFGYAPSGLLDPWDLDELERHGITPDMFPEALWERSFVDGQLYAIPLDFHAFILMYNKELAEQAGLLDENGDLVSLDSQEALLDAGRALAEVTGETGISFGYTGSGSQMERMFWGLYAQTGAPVELTPGEEAVIDREAAIEVVSFVQEMLDDTVATANLDYDGGVAAFSTGRTGMIFTGNWELPAFQAAGIDVGAVPMPTVFEEPANYGDAHVFVLPHQDNVDEETRNAAYETVAGMLRNSLNWAAGGHIPANLEVRESEEYQALEPQSDYAVAADRAAFVPQAWFTGSGSTFEAEVGNALQDAWLNKSDPGQAVDRLIAALNDNLAAEPPAQA